MTKPLPDQDLGGIHTSVMLCRLIAEAETNKQITLHWLISQAPKNAFGFVVLFLSLVSIVPIVDFLARLILLPMLFKAMFGNVNLNLPRKLLMLNIPVPFINIPLAVATALFALAYIEYDGLLLFMALMLAILMLALIAMPTANYIL